MADMSAKAVLEQALGQYGLSSLAEWAWNRYLETGSTDLVFLELRKQPAYKARFPAMDALAAKGQAISEAAYVEYESTLQKTLHQYGIPTGMYDTPQAVANLLTNDVSVAEVNDRIRIASVAAMQAPEEVRTALADQYGITGGGLVGYFLDPDKAMPILEKQWAAAQVTGAARLQEIAIDTATSERLAAQGITYDEAINGFGQVAGQGGLQTGAGETVGQGDLVNAAFGVAEAQKKVTRVQKSRTARFQEGGGATGGVSGVTGLGSSSG